MDSARKMAAALFLQYETAHICNVRDIEDEKGNTTDAIYRCSIGRADRRDVYALEGWNVLEVEGHPSLVELHPDLTRMRAQSGSCVPTGKCSNRGTHV